MKRLILAFLVLFAAPVFAAEITINVPNGQVADAQAMCEELRVQMRVDTATWGNKQCAEEFFRRGLRAFKKASVIRNAESQKQQDIATERDLFDARFPVDSPIAGRPDPPRIMTCGDGIVDSDLTIPYVEECDDGNTTSGDGCDEECNVEP